MDILSGVGLKDAVVAAVLAAAWGWHRSEVREAVSRAEAAREAAERALAAREALARDLTEARRKVAALEASIEEYANETPVPPDCRAGADLIGRLRSMAH